MVLLDDHASLVEAIKKVDVVISTLGGAQVTDQLNIIKAIKEVETIKRFLPSEFGYDVDKVDAVEPAKSIFTKKANIRRPLRPKAFLIHMSSATLLQIISFAIWGSQALRSPRGIKSSSTEMGLPKAAVFVKEEDVGILTIKAVDDPRTLNKTLYVRPPGNILSFNEIVTIWEGKIGKTLEKVYVSEEQLLKTIAETPFPANIGLAIGHSIFVNGDQTNFEIGPDGVEASELYPDVKYTTVDEYLSQYV